MSDRLRDFPAEVAYENSISNEAYSGGSDVNGSSVDMIPGAGQQFLSGVAVCEIWGGSAGDEIVIVLEHSSDDSSWSALNDQDGNQLTVTLEDASGLGRIDIQNIEFDRYVRATIDDSASTIPGSTNVHVTFSKGGAVELPAN